MDLLLQQELLMNCTKKKKKKASLDAISRNSAWETKKREKKREEKLWACKLTLLQVLVKMKLLFQTIQSEINYCYFNTINKT